jgi:hypothetical protein
LLRVVRSSGVNEAARLLRAQASRGKAPTAGARSSCLDCERLWALHLVVVSRDPGLCRAAESLKGDVASVSVTQAPRSVVSMASRCAGTEWIMLFDIDFFSDTRDAVATLSEIRARNRRIPLVVASGSFTATLPGSHSMGIAEAALRLPLVSAEPLAEALCTAARRFDPAPCAKNT